MNEESQASRSKKNINFREIYKFLNEASDKSSSKMFPTLRSKLYNQNSPRILPILSIKPPSLPKSSGLLIRTIRNEKNEGFMNGKTFVIDGGRRSPGRGSKVKIDGKLNRSGVLLRTVDLERSKIRMNPLGNEKKNGLISVKDQGIKKKLLTLEEVLIKTDKLSGWDTN